MSEKHVEWYWKSNDDLFVNTDIPEWTRYSDIENIIIEEAFTKLKKPVVMLDDYHIDFEHRIQISNDNKNKKRPVKRMEMNRENRRLRKARFTPNPISPSSSFHDLVGLEKIFIDSFMKQFKIKSYNDWENQKYEIVDKAMSGILYEGQLAGKQYEAKWINQQLEKVRSKTKRIIGEMCVYLYSLESFLYKILNQTMRLIGDKDHENVWRSKLETLGPFAFLLFYYLSYENTTHRTGTTIYRGAQLSNEMLAEYRRAAQSKDSRRSFQAFTSCSRNRTKAEQFGNVLFVISPEKRTSFRTSNMDIAFLSAYPDEEEVLIRPGRTFRIERVEFDRSKNKHIIYLTLIYTTDKQ
jgi:hypothetical protein